MSESAGDIGVISWIDLTVKEAESTVEFYQQVVGWAGAAVEMDGYDDFNMQTPAGKTVAGICHARGVNADVPAQWLVYIHVADLEASLAACRQLGGQVLCQPRQVGNGRCAVIRDPAGACAALYQSCGGD